MDVRIVTSFRLPTPPRSRADDAPGAGAGLGPGRTLLERARSLESRAAPRGAVLVAWGAFEIAFAWPADAIEKVVDLVTTASEDVLGDEPPWAIGIAQGELARLAEDGTRGALAWGRPLLAASTLAAAARPGEILCSPTLRAARSGELLTVGTRMAKRGGMRVRGLRVDGARPWRRQAVEQLAHMRVAPLVGAPPLPSGIAPGSLVVLRADPGAGGTRALTELAAAAPRALVVAPSGSGFEPLGALRRALARSVTRELDPLLLERAAPLGRLLEGSAVSLDEASGLVTAFLWRKTGGETPPLVLVDDAKAVDPATLEACVRAARMQGVTFALVARLDATGGLPSVLAQLPRAAEIELAPLEREAAEALAGGCTSDALDADARKRWASLGGNVPLGIVESVAWGIVTGELVWDGDEAKPRSRASGRGKVRPPAEWIGLRARDENEACRTLLGLVAMLGGEAKVTRLARILERAEMRHDVESVVEELVRSRWLVDTQEDWVGLPSRTHREALAALVAESVRVRLHVAAAFVIESEEGGFGRAEAAWHAAQGGEATRASGMLLAAAKATAEARFETTTTQLIAFARRADPTCEEAALEILANAIARGVASAPPLPMPQSPRMPSPSVAAAAPFAAAEESASASASGPVPTEREHLDSEPPTIARLDLPRVAPDGALPSFAVDEASPDPSEASIAGTNIATRLGELAKEALLNADSAALERWVDGLRAAGESPIYTDRMRALSRLGRGDIGDALRVLRRTRAQLDPKDHRVRCQTSLALGVALSVAGRPDEALLEGLDALARARQIADEQGAAACVAFLAKLYTSIGRVEAERLRGGGARAP